MKILIIAAHGSRKKESAKEVAALAAKLSSKKGAQFDRIDHGFLQFSEPFLPDVIENAVAKGAKEIVIFPFFISAGSHILQDIPELVEKSGKTYPEVAFSVTRHLGIIDGIGDLIINEVACHLVSVNTSNKSEAR